MLLERLFVWFCMFVLLRFVACVKLTIFGHNIDCGRRLVGWLEPSVCFLLFLVCSRFCLLERL